MAGYFGTEEQRRLQAQAETQAAWINVTPGACQSCRFMGCDQPEQLGWNVIDQILERDGLCGFRMVPANVVNDLVSRFAKRGFRMDFWDVFTADRARGLQASESIVAQGPSNGMSDLAAPTNPVDEYTVRIQTLMAEAGVVPFSGSMLTGAVGPATTVAVGDEGGAVVAAAHGYFPHNRYSRYHRYAWGGLAAVAASQRGKGLGRYVNARLVVSVFSNLKAEHIYELVSVTNAPSRRMLKACGLRLDPTIVCGMAMRSHSTRFTR